MDASTSILQTISNTTNLILEAVQSGGGDSSNYLTTDGEQTISNKAFDNTNSFPTTLITREQLTSAVNNMVTYAEKTMSVKPLLTIQTLSVTVNNTTHNITIPIVDGDDTPAGFNSTQTLSNKNLLKVSLYGPTDGILTLPNDGTLPQMTYQRFIYLTYPVL